MHRSEIPPRENPRARDAAEASAGRGSGISSRTYEPSIVALVVEDYRRLRFDERKGMSVGMGAGSIATPAAAGGGAGFGEDLLNLQGGSEGHAYVSPHQLAQPLLL